MARLTHTLATIVFIFSFAFTAQSQVPDSTKAMPQTKSRAVEYFYIHGAIGLGMDVYSSSDIEAMLVDDLNIQKVGFPFQYSIRAGYRNIAQFEFRKYNSSDHNIGTGGFVNGEIVSQSVSMKLKETDLLFKINPALWKWTKPTSGRPAKCLFVILGNADITYHDKIDEGFEGSGVIYGLEWAGISKYMSFTIGATYHAITYDKARLFDTDFHSDIAASRFLLYTTLGFGYGR